MSKSNLPLTVKIIDGTIAIVVGTRTLAYCTPEAINRYNEDEGDYVSFYVTDEDEFARDVVYALTDEAEDGSSALTRCLDDAIRSAVDNGSMAISDHEIGFELARDKWASSGT